MLRTVLPLECVGNPYSTLRDNSWSPDVYHLYRVTMKLEEKMSEMRVVAGEISYSIILDILVWT